MKLRITLFLFIVLGTFFSVKATSYDTIAVNLSSNPDSTWTLTTNGNLVGTHCGQANSIQFTVNLSSHAAGFTLDIIGNNGVTWKLDCGTSHQVKDTVCSGGGTHTIVFSKPGNNQYTWIIKSIAKPTFPQESDSLRSGCNYELVTKGAKAGTVHWNSIFSKTYGYWNYLIDSVSNPSVPTIDISKAHAADLPLPSYLTFQVSAFPANNVCGIAQLTVTEIG